LDVLTIISQYSGNQYASRARKRRIQASAGMPPLPADVDRAGLGAIRNIDDRDT
jgi:hypothetical protein